MKGFKLMEVVNNRLSMALYVGATTRDEQGQMEWSPGGHPENDPSD
jgi:hypothetical protein